MQVSDALEPLVHVVGLRHKLVAGGLSYTTQINALNAGVDLLVATPGRLNDLIERGAVELGDIEIAHPRRGRPHGRHGLHARGHRDPRPDPGGRPAAALLGDPRPRHRPAGRALPHRPGDALHRRRHGLGHHDGAPRAAHRPDAQEDHHRRDRQPRGPHRGLRAHQARRRPRRAPAARAGRLRRRAARRPQPGRPQPRPRRLPRRARCRCWSPPTSPPAASTSTTSPWSCRSTRRPTTRTTCTAPAARHAPATRAPSSPWRCRTSARAWSGWPARPASTRCRPRPSPGDDRLAATGATSPSGIPVPEDQVRRVLEGEKRGRRPGGAPRSSGARTGGYRGQGGRPGQRSERPGGFRGERGDRSGYRGARA